MRDARATHNNAAKSKNRCLRFNGFSFSLRTDSKLSHITALDALMLIGFSFNHRNSNAASTFYLATSNTHEHFPKCNIKFSRVHRRSFPHLKLLNAKLKYPGFFGVMKSHPSKEASYEGHQEAFAVNTFRLLNPAWAQTEHRSPPAVPSALFSWSVHTISAVPLPPRE